jgi:hypothetical protein
VFRFTGLVSAVVLVAACSTPDVTSEEGLPLPEVRWKLGSPHFPPIGVVDTPASHALDRPRMVRMGPSGFIHVLNGPAEIRVFTQGGQFLRSIGRVGEGPGEFKSIHQYRPLRDGGWMVLAGTGHLVRLDKDGVEVTRARVSRVVETVNIGSAMTPDGELVGFDRTSVLGRDSNVGRWRVVRDTVPVMLFNHEGAVAAEYGPFPGYPWRVRGGGWNSVPLGPRPAIAAGTGMIAVTDGSQFSVHLLRRDRTGSVVLVLAEEPEPVMPADLDGWFEEERAFYRSRGLPIPAEDPELADYAPDLLPAYSRLVIDAPGCVWAMRSRRPSESQNLWDVFAPAGKVLAQVATPLSLSVEVIQRGFLLGIEEDEWGVGRIVAPELGPDASSRICSPLEP